MAAELTELEQLLLAILAADDTRRQEALRVLQGESLTEARATDTTGPVLMNVTAAAKYLGVSRTTLWRIIRDGGIEQVEVRSGSFRLRKVDLDRFAGNRK